MYGSTATADGKRIAFVKQTLRFTGYLADLEAGATRIANTRHFTLTDSRDFPVDWTRRQQGRHRVVRSDWPLEHLQATAELGNGGAARDRDGGLGKPASECGRQLGSLPTGKRAHPRGARSCGFPSPEDCRRWFSRRGRGVGSSGPGRRRACARLPSRRRIASRLVITAFDPVKGRGRELTRFDIDPNHGVLESGPFPGRDTNRRDSKSGGTDPRSFLERPGAAGNPVEGLEEPPGCELGR